MDLRAGRKAARVRLVDLIALIDLEREVLYPNLVITVCPAVRWPDPEHRACGRAPSDSSLASAAGFDWGDAGIGAVVTALLGAAALGAVLLGRRGAAPLQQ